MTLVVAVVGCLLYINVVNGVDQCELSARIPQKSQIPLKFCNMFPADSCCVPVQDAEIEEHYSNLLEAGDICAKASSQAKNALRKVFCFGCSPKMIEYFDGESVSICSGLANQLDLKEFDECGMVRVDTRGDLCAGDDTVVPSREWANPDEFLADNSGAKPPFFEDFGVTIVPCDSTVASNNCHEQCYTGAASHRLLSISCFGLVVLLSLLFMAS